MICLPGKTNQRNFSKIPCLIKDKLGVNIRIRAYQVEDYPRLIDMYDRFEPKRIAMGLPHSDKKLRDNWIDCILSSFFNTVAICQNKIIGHAAIDILRNKSSPEYMIFLDQDFRNRGIGTSQTMIIKKICEEFGCKQIWVAITCHSMLGIKLFKKLGFKFTGTIGPEREMVLKLKPKSKR
jgi:RimJ/RimL family protein N-acetyltransferase